MCQLRHCSICLRPLQTSLSRPERSLLSSTSQPLGHPRYNKRPLVTFKRVWSFTSIQISMKKVNNRKCFNQIKIFSEDMNISWMETLLSSESRCITLAFWAWKICIESIFEHWNRNIPKHDIPLTCFWAKASFSSSKTLGNFSACPSFQTCKAFFVSARGVKDISYVLSYCLFFGLWSQSLFSLCSELERLKCERKRK